MKKIVLIIPCYFEEEILPSSFESLNSLYQDLKGREVISADSAICFVDDGSADNTWAIIKSLVKQYKWVIGIRLSRNFGQQFASLAGLEQLSDQFDGYITLDVDLQDDINVIEEMVSKQEEGASVVYGVRDDRSTDTFFKRNNAAAFYKLLRLMKVNTVYNHSEFRLIDNTVLGNLLRYNESNLYLRGVFPEIGYKSEKVYFKRQPRKMGRTKWGLKKQISLAWEGITSFSAYPLRIVLYAGLLTFAISVIIGAWVLYVKISGRDIQGWTSLMLVILFFSSLQMIFMGIFGEYLGKVYKEVKKRPRYIIEEVVSGGEGGNVEC
jgi:glycosyltransferase involved in cell wall biosynthesis